MDLGKVHLEDCFTDNFLVLELTAKCENVLEKEDELILRTKRVQLE